MSLIYERLLKKEEHYEVPSSLSTPREELKGRAERLTHNSATFSKLITWSAEKCQCSGEEADTAAHLAAGAHFLLDYTLI